ncbi:MAG: phosphotransferase [Armatimonadetes bacterium]|nr:phosphotransferase [Anaerolineae bacterium]
MEDYPEVQVPLERAMLLWWGQFKGQHAITTLRALFPRPNDYEYLLVMARTLRAVREFIRQPLRTMDTLHLLRELTNIKTSTVESSEVRSLKKALRSWIQFDITGAIERLKLGFSDANVVRIQPFVWSPLASGDDKPESFIKHSLIIKYGPSDSIEAERRNYDALPAATRDFFVRIPESSYTDPDNGLSFVIMQDLRNYKTLYEQRELAARRMSEVADQLGNFLVRMHEGGSSQWRPMPKTLLREMYFGKMMEYTDRVFDFIAEKDFFPDEARRTAIEEVQSALFECIGQIIQRQKRLEGFPSAYMHGDLHLRNIMVYGLESEARTASGLTFKLIDLEFMRRDGDAAFDAGQLLIDLELVAADEQKHANREKLQKLAAALETSYTDFSAIATRHDDTFETRVQLAKARALLRIAKGKTKRGGYFLQNNQDALAQQIAEDVVKHAEAALKHVQAVAAALA